MRYPFPLLFLLLGCGNASSISTKIIEDSQPDVLISLNRDNEKSWNYFLKHLPVVEGPVLDYRGQPVSYQDKHVGIIPYDVGRADLQQCADALMRIRAEYLFGEKRYDEIGFHFTGGQYYSWNDYCKGKKPVPSGNGIRFIQTVARSRTHESLRNYLDIVYTYASTISLAKGLKPADGFEVGTVVIHPGSPGHCFMIIDEKKDAEGKKLFKLAEGYTPAQSIYVLRNLDEFEKTPWHRLTRGVIETASYRFEKYELGRFE